MTTTSSCTMMLAVMYGMMPSAMIDRENSSLRRRSGVRNAAANACSTCPPLLGRMRLATSPTVRWGGRAADDPGARRAPRGHRRSDACGAAPRRADLLGGGGGEGVRVHVHLHAAQVAGAEDLHRLATAHGAGLGEGVGVHRAALGEQGRDPVEVDDLEDDLVRVLEARELRQSHVQRRLPALEPRGGVPARAGALGAATGRLALGALTATHAGLGGVGAGGRAQVVDLESHCVSLLS